MKAIFIEYPKCTTCIKAKKYLLEKGIELDVRHINEQTPTKEELKKYYELSQLPIKRLFNTSGKLYKELNLKEKVSTMREDEALSLLSENGMLIKRPILILNDHVFFGFKEEIYNDFINKSS